ncbi:hypothetical protein PIB30_091128 [Stylosanthes scabra]|uniref:Uncharacterized protein n=1 Tax=Stylosanthes scabra TaxID=79078 RepID=A0ABU6YX94_9FABA|nr:hypothetical protein [Stylosanthes scabra]
MKINSVDPASTKPPERSGKTIGNNSQDKESSEDFSAISPIPAKEEKKKKESAAYMPKPPFPQRLKAENKNKTPKKEPKEEKGATNDSKVFATSSLSHHEKTRSNVKLMTIKERLFGGNPIISILSNFRT